MMALDFRRDLSVSPLLARTKIGACDEDEKGAEITAKLAQYMRGFMDDPSYVSKGNEPSGRASWPDANGNPTDSFSSPYAHRKFFEWWANGAPCIDVASINNLLYAIGVEETLCTFEVAPRIAHLMDKGADDNCITWAEYLNHVFTIGPGSITGLPDPTVAQFAAEAGGGAATSPPPGDPVFLYTGGDKPATDPIFLVTYPLLKPSITLTDTRPKAPAASGISTPVLVASGIGLGALLWLLFL